MERNPNITAANIYQVYRFIGKTRKLSPAFICFRATSYYLSPMEGLAEGAGVARFINLYLA
jgi:hypothetical protein